MLYQVTSIIPFESSYIVKLKMNEVDPTRMLSCFCHKTVLTNVVLVTKKNVLRPKIVVIVCYMLGQHITRKNFILVSY